MNYLLPLLAMIALCAGWAVFQVWLSRHDPDANQCLRNCGSCSCGNEKRSDANRSAR